MTLSLARLSQTRRRGGRPSREAAALLPDAILDAATPLFLRDGYAATSMEQVATGAGVAKRTLYVRHPDKAHLFQAVVARMIARWLPDFTADTVPDEGLEATLTQAAREILAVALTPEAMALYRVMLLEGHRFPEMVAAMQAAGVDSGARRIAAVLAKAVAAGTLRTMDPGEAAECFMAMVLSVPQRRMVSGRDAIDPARWATDATKLFLEGARHKRE